MNVAISFSLLEICHRVICRKRPANQAVEADYFAVELYPVRFRGEQPFDGVLDFDVLLARVRHSSESPYSGGCNFSEMRGHRLRTWFSATSNCFPASNRVRASLCRFLQPDAMQAVMALLANHAKPGLGRLRLLARRPSQGPVKILIDRIMVLYTCQN